MKEKIRSVIKILIALTWIRMWPLKTVNTFVNGVASKKDKPIYCEMRIRSNSVRLQVTVEPLLALSPEVTLVTPSSSHVTFP